MAFGFHLGSCRCDCGCQCFDYVVLDEWVAAPGGHPIDPNLRHYPAWSASHVDQVRGNSLLLEIYDVTNQSHQMLNFFGVAVAAHHWIVDDGWPLQVFTLNPKNPDNFFNNGAAPAVFDWNHGSATFGRSYQLRLYCLCCDDFQRATTALSWFKNYAPSFFDTWDFVHVDYDVYCPSRGVFRRVAECAPSIGVFGGTTTSVKSALRTIFGGEVTAWGSLGNLHLVDISRLKMIWIAGAAVTRSNYDSGPAYTTNDYLRGSFADAVQPLLDWLAIGGNVLVFDNGEVSPTFLASLGLSSSWNPIDPEANVPPSGLNLPDYLRPTFFSDPGTPSLDGSRNGIYANSSALIKPVGSHQILSGLPDPIFQFSAAGFFGCMSHTLSRAYLYSSAAALFANFDATLAATFLAPNGGCVGNSVVYPIAAVERLLGSTVITTALTIAGDENFNSGGMVQSSGLANHFGQQFCFNVWALRG